MKLARYDLNGNPTLGVVSDDRFLPLTSLGIDLPDMITLIESEGALERISVALSGSDQAGIPLDPARLLPPLRPGKFLALGMNYRRHVEEARALGIAVPDNQVWFNKQTTCINSARGDVVRGATEKLDYEAELGVVIGKMAKSVRAADALDHVFGYLVVNDVSARDWQFASPTITMGKSFDTHGPIGPWITTRDEVPDPQALNIRCFVNDECRQDSNTAQFIFSIAEQIEHLSTAFTLEPGDIISTGTPEGVGAAMQPPRFLVPGDVVRTEIEGLGRLENRVAA